MIKSTVPLHWVHARVHYLNGNIVAVEVTVSIMHHDTTGQKDHFVMKCSLGLGM